MILWIHMKRKVSTLDFLTAHPVFSLAEAVESLEVPAGPKALLARLTYHVGRGRIRRITRGVYAVVPAGVDPRRLRPDPFLVTAKTRPDAVFSHHSALELLGVAQSLWGRVTAFTRRPRPSLTVGAVTVLLLPDPGPLRAGRRRALGTRVVDREGTLLRATGPERTLVEGFRRPARVGGLEELVRSCTGFPTLDLDLLHEVLAAYRSRTLWASVGWFLERHQRTFAVSERVLRGLERRRPRSPQYLPRATRGGRFYRRWNLVLPDSLTRPGGPDEP